MAAMATTRQTPRKKASPAQNTALKARVEDLETRVKTIEELISATKVHQQQKAAAMLAQNPQRMAELEQLLQLAQQQTGQADASK